MKNRLRMIAREYEELSVCPGRGLGMLNMCRTEKSKFVLFIVIHAGRIMLCARAETHRRGVAH